MKTKTGAILPAGEGSVDTPVMILVRSMIFLRLLESEIPISLRFVDIQGEKLRVSAWMTHYLMFVVLSLFKMQLAKKVSTRGHAKSRRSHKNDDDEFVIDTVASTPDGTLQCECFLIPQISSCQNPRITPIGRT